MNKEKLEQANNIERRIRTVREHLNEFDKFEDLKIKADVNSAESFFGFSSWHSLKVRVEIPENPSPDGMPNTAMKDKDFHLPSTMITEILGKARLYWKLKLDALEKEYEAL